MKASMDQLSAHLDRGWDLVSRGDLAGARTSAERSLEIDAQSADGHNLMGYVCAAQGDLDTALEHYRHALEADETFFEAMLNAAEILIHPFGKPDEAIALMDDALDFVDLPEERAEALLTKVDAFLHSGRREEAAATLRLLPDGPFEAPHIEFLIGRAKFELGDAAGASPHLDAALRQETGNADVHYYRALVAETLGDPRAATASFLEARALDLTLPAPPWSLRPEEFERHVQTALTRLPPTLSASLAGALVVVCDVPGAEVVADGVDPRQAVLADDVDGRADPPRIGRLFVYQRNIERLQHAEDTLEADLASAIAQEVDALRAAALGAKTGDGR